MDPSHFIEALIDDLRKGGHAKSPIRNSVAATIEYLEGVTPRIFDKVMGECIDKLVEMGKAVRRLPTAIPFQVSEPAHAEQLFALVVYSQQWKPLPKSDPWPAQLYSECNRALRVTASGRDESSMTVDRASKLTALLQPFICGVVEACKRLEPQRLVTYRGEGFVRKTRVGSVTRFDAFTSSSSKKSIADGFAMKSPERAKQSALIVFQICSGRFIQFASVCPEEEEYLLVPGSEFKVVTRASAALRSVLRMPLVR
jgi:hypothetical protein